MSSLYHAIDLWSFGVLSVAILGIERSVLIGGKVDGSREEGRGCNYRVDGKLGAD